MTRQSFRPLVTLLFILSGATGLVYQIVWFKYLSLFLGNTTYVQTVVLASYMGGLAIGAALWGRSADRVKRPIIIYAVLETLVGLYCLFYPALIEWIRNGAFSAVSRFGWSEGSVGVLILKLLVSGLTLLPPTILMGGTLPVLVRSLSERIADAGKEVAVLYFVNSVGAVIGTLLGGLFLIRLLGLSIAIRSAALLNVAVGVVALAAGWRLPAAPPATSLTEGTGEEYRRRERTAAVIVAGLSGTAAMIYEVSWVRILIPVFGSSTYSFSIMLVGFISGIALGSWLVSIIFRSGMRGARFLIVCQLGAAIALLVLLPVYGRLPYAFWQLASLFARSPATFPLLLSSELFIVFVIILVPTIFLGMTLPVASRMAARDFRILGFNVGTVFSINTAGTVVGSLAAGLLLIPLIGVRHTFEAGILLNLAAGLFMLVASQQVSRIFRRVVVAVPLVAVLLYLLVASDWSQSVMLSGVFRKLSMNSPPPASYAEFLSQFRYEKILYYKEGSDATVAVGRAFPPETPQSFLIINGKPDASSVTDLPTQVLLGQLPMLMRPSADTVLIVGLGSGVTAGSVLTHPARAVDCIELSPEVVTASSYFDDVNHHALEDRRLRVVVEDAITFLHLTRRRYDVIVSEPSNPWIAGIGNLYTREFFRLCRTKLRDGGMMVQWFHLYDTNDGIFKVVLRTFRSAFPYVSVWNSLERDVLLVGTDSPQRLDRASLATAMRRPDVHDDLTRIDVDDPMLLLSLESMSPSRARVYAGYGPVNTEDLPVLEYAAPRELFVQRGVTEFFTMDERSELSGRDLLLDSLLAISPATPGDLARLGLLHSTPTRGNLRFAYSLLREAHRQDPRNDAVTRRLAETAEMIGKTEEAKGLWGEYVARRPNDVGALEHLAQLTFTTEHVEGSRLVPLNAEPVERLLRRGIAVSGDSTARFGVELGDLFAETQRYADAESTYLHALDVAQLHQDLDPVPYDVIYTKLARCLYRQGRIPKALEYAAKASLWNPESVEIKEMVYTLAMIQIASNRKP